MICVVALAGMAQGLRELNSATPRGTNEATRLVIKRPVASSAKKGEKSGPDYVLYRNLVRRNSWLEGQGSPITQREADSLPYYFRLSMRNARGHWQFVEALKGSSLTSDHPLTPYILDKGPRRPGDTDATGEWREKIAAVGQWFLTADLSGENLVEERAYEAKADSAGLIYVFQPVRLDDGTVIATFLNDWGLPVDIDESESHYYGNVVRITYGAGGLDSVVDFLDSKGLRRYNEYGVDRVGYEFDGRGLLVRKTNRNLVGNLMRDNRGYVGYDIEYIDGQVSETGIETLE